MSLVLSPGILKTEQLSVWGSMGVVIPWMHRCSSRVSAPVKVEWEPDKTELVSARLVVSKAVAQNDYTTLKIWLNGILVKTLYWPAGAKGTEKSAVIDITVPLRSGTNNFEVALCRDIPLPSTATATISAYLEYEYTGEDPETELLKDLLAWLKKNWWVAIPILGVALISSRRRY